MRRVLLRCNRFIFNKLAINDCKSFVLNLQKENNLSRVQDRAIIFENNY